MSATACSRSAAVRSVPLTTLPVFASTKAPSERGKNSYQEENSARGAVDEERVGPLDGEQVAQRVGGEDLGQGVRLGSGEPRLDRAVRCP